METKTKKTELSDLIEKFVLKKENTKMIVDLTRLSTEYFSHHLSNKNYDYSLHKIKDYLTHHKEFKGINPRKFSIELMKYLYENRIR